MKPVFVRAVALASALATDLDAAAARLLSGPPLSNRAVGTGEWPYFAIPFSAPDWMQRAQALARGVADALQREAALSRAQWACLPLIVGSSSYAIGATEARPDAALATPEAFCRLAARWFGVQGETLAVTTACTSGLHALDIAAGLVASGSVPQALVLGVELSNRFTLRGFAGLELLSRTGARPCDRARDGMVLGEALGAVLLSADGNCSRPWRIAARAVGMDAASLTGPDPNGRVIAETLRAAIDSAGWTPASVDLVKLQAAGSPASDVAEARALRTIFAPLPRLLSLKGALGHALGASGPAELALLIASLARGRIPATWGFDAVDEELGLAPSAGDGADVERVLFNLFGFGGSVATLALERN